MWKLNKISAEHLSKLFFGLAIFTLPIQITTILYQTSWGRGFINPYTSVWVSLTEILIVASAIAFFLHLKKKKKKINTGENIFFLMLIGMILIASASLIISPYKDPIFKLLSFTKLLELLLIYLLVVNKVLKPRNMLEIFIISMSLQALLAFSQVILQHSIGLQILGEPHLSDQTANIARFTVGDITLLRGYGTFSHPNVLGGFLVTSLLCSLLFSPHLKHERKLLLAIQFLGLLATFSRTAILAFMIAIIIIAIWYLPKIKGKKNKLIPIGLIALFTIEMLFLIVSRGLNFLKDPAVIERIEGYKASAYMFVEYPLGVGFQHFTLFLDEVSNANLMPWEYQPVHNIFLLLLNEVGIIGLVCAVLIGIIAFKKLHEKTKKLLPKHRLFKKRIFLVLVISFTIIATFDHYLITQEQGRILLVLIYAIISIFSDNPRHILPIKKEGDLNKILAVR